MASTHGNLVLPPSRPVAEGGTEDHRSRRAIAPPIASRLSDSAFASGPPKVSSPRCSPDAYGDRIAMVFAAVHESAFGRYCCKSLFALLIKNSLGSRCDFGINMRGASSHSDELTGDFGNKPEAILIGDHFLSCLLAEKLSLRDLRLLQQYRHKADIRGTATFWSLLENSGHSWILGRDGLSAYDPSATLAVQCSNGFDAGFSPYRRTRLSR